MLRLPWSALSHFLGANRGRGAMDVDAFPLRILVCWARGQATVVLRGALDAATATEALRCLAATLDSDPQCLVLNLAGVTSMDMQGITFIARARSGLPSDREVIIRSPAPAVREVLAITGMAETCTIEEPGG